MFSKKRVIISIGITILLGGIFFGYKAGRTITVIGDDHEAIWAETISEFSKIPEREEARVDVLFIGIRGINGDDKEPMNGELLADTIILASLNKDNGKAALISIPRDLYVEIPDYGEEKINAAYAVGEARRPGGGGLQLMKALVSVLSGVYVDYAVSVDFEGFQKIIGDIGEITIYRTSPFEEPKQWIHDGREDERYWKLEESGWVFYIPEGKNLMNSEEALYYARSRYSSSDFDRMRRQHEIIEAVKSKALSLGVLVNPVKIFNILDTLGDNVRSDMDISEMKELIDTIKDGEIEDWSKVFLEENENGGLLVSGNVDGKYVLLPKGGNYDEIRQMFKGVVE